MSQLASFRNKLFGSQPRLSARFDQTSRLLHTGYERLGKTHLQRMLVASLVLHALVLAVRFVPNEFNKIWDKEALLVVMVNAAEEKPPTEAQALANANLQGGGEAEAGLVSSPLPNMERSQDGDELSKLKQEVQALEQQQAALLAALKGQSNMQSPSGKPQPFNPLIGNPNASADQALMRQIASLDKQVQDYNKRPKRKQLSPATKEAAFAAYFAQWTERTEQLGNQSYPDAIKGQSAELMVTVSIRKDGSLESVSIVGKGSGKREIDRAALQLIRRLAPYPAFTANIREQIDVLDITTRLIFTPSNSFSAQVFAPDATGSGSTSGSASGSAASTSAASPTSAAQR